MDAELYALYRNSASPPLWWIKALEAEMGEGHLVFPPRPDYDWHTNLLDAVRADTEAQIARVPTYPAYTLPGLVAAVRCETCANVARYQNMRRFEESSMKPSGIWITRTGTRIHMQDMTESHLYNAWRYFNQRGTEEAKKHHDDLNLLYAIWWRLECLETEMRRRGATVPPRDPCLTDRLDLLETAAMMEIDFPCGRGYLY